VPNAYLVREPPEEVVRMLPPEERMVEPPPVERIVEDEDERVDEGVYELLERVVVVERTLGLLERVGVVLVVRTLVLLERVGVVLVVRTVVLLERVGVVLDERVTEVEVLRDGDVAVLALVVEVVLTDVDLVLVVVVAARWVLLVELVRTLELP
jgi:hypothetical protein